MGAPSLSTDANTKFSTANIKAFSYHDVRVFTWHTQRALLHFFMGDTVMHELRQHQPKSYVQPHHILARRTRTRREEPVKGGVMRKQLSYQRTSFVYWLWFRWNDVSVRPYVNRAKEIHAVSMSFQCCCATRLARRLQTASSRFRGSRFVQHGVLCGYLGSTKPQQTACDMVFASRLPRPASATTSAREMLLPPSQA